MRHPKPDALVEAVNSLARIRAVESEPDAEGLRTVWHQGAKGADLVSWVDVKGHVTRQDFTLIDDHFTWTSAKGLLTGWVEDDTGSKAMKGAAAVFLDPKIA